MFTEQLRLDLTLRPSSGDSVAVPGGDVKQFRIVLRPFGFEAEVAFWTRLDSAADPVLGAVTGTGLLKARLDVKGVHGMPTTPPDPLSVQGVVTRRQVLEETAEGVAGVPVRYRRYTLRFADAAHVLWRQHRPCELAADLSIGDFIDRHRAEGITVDADWDRLLPAQPIVCLALGDEEGGPSFYDFVAWFVDTRAGAFTYDAKENRYLLSAKKPKTGSPVLLPASEVSRLDLVAPERGRHDARVLNASTLGTPVTPLTHDESVTGISRDALVRTAIAASTDDRKTIEAGRLLATEAEPTLRVELSRLPTVAFRPGVLVKLSPSAGWSDRLHGVGPTHRVTHLELEGEASDPSPESDAGLPFTGYGARGTARLELDTDPTRHLPRYRAPRWPVLLEGKVQAAGGQETDRRWQVEDDERSGQAVYTVLVPLFNAKIKVPCIPDQMPGHFWFPAYKNSAVLLEVGFDEARLARYLDWGPDVRLPADGQGDHLLLGFNAQSHTWIRHDFQDSKPVLGIQRFAAGDQQLLELKEGTITLNVKADAAAATTVETYDVSLQVEMAKGELSGKVGGGIALVSTKFGGAQSKVSGAIDGASSEVQGKLQETSSAVSAKLDEAKAKLGAARAALSSSVDALAPQVAGAIAELRGKLA